MKSLIFSVLLVGLAQSGFGQHTDRFLVNVVEFVPPNNMANTLRGSGTIISPRHVLTAATVAQVAAPRQLGIEIHTTLANGTVMREFISIERVITHPQFVVGQNRLNNLAIIEMSDELARTEFPPRVLGTLVTNETFNLFGWGGSAQNPERSPVVVFAPEFCDVAATQAFCSRFDADFVRGCTARIGAPIMSTDSTQIAGVVISEQCSPLDDIYVLNIHSIQPFSSWIREISGAEKATKISAFVILSAVLISIRGWF